MPIPLLCLTFFPLGFRTIHATWRIGYRMPARMISNGSGLHDSPEQHLEKRAPRRVVLKFGGLSRTERILTLSERLTNVRYVHWQIRSGNRKDMLVLQSPDFHVNRLFLTKCVFQIQLVRQPNCYCLLCPKRSIKSRGDYEPVCVVPTNSRSEL